MNRSQAYRVLLIEDDELDARSVVSALTTENQCEVHRASDLASALHAINSKIFDCILLDLSLPDSEGLVSVDTMLARSPHCPVVVLTGLDDPTVAIESMARGAQDYLVKDSITPELVIRAIRYAVARHSTDVTLRDVQARLADMDAREQIARDLHDTVIQRLFATGMSLQAAVSMGSRDELVERAGTAVDEIDEAIRELRRAIFGLHTFEADDSITVELSRLAESYAATLGFAPVMRLGDLPRVSAALSEDLLAVAREALSNVSRHATNASAVTVSVHVEADQLVLRVTDNGEPQDASRSAADSELSGRGMGNMASRAESHGGTILFESEASRGTELVWSVPLDSLHH